MKTYISRSRAEVLRRSYAPGAITGYPVRSITALRFRNPITCRALDAKLALRNMIEQWNLFQLRGVDPQGVAEQ